VFYISLLKKKRFNAALSIELCYEQNMKISPCTLNY